MYVHQFFACGLVLIPALLGGCATEAPSTAEAGKSSYGVREGGQAGFEEHIERRTGVSDQSADRIGGQAGLEEHMEKGTGAPDQSIDRIGGQAGEEKPLEQR